MDWPAECHSIEGGWPGTSSSQCHPAMHCGHCPLPALSPWHLLPLSKQLPTFLTLCPAGSPSPSREPSCTVSGQLHVQTPAAAAGEQLASCWKSVGT